MWFFFIKLLQIKLLWKNYSSFVGFVLLSEYFMLDSQRIQTDLISGFSAKSMASGHFIDNRSQEIIEKGTMISIWFLPKHHSSMGKILHQLRFMVWKNEKVYREGLGATLINDDFDVSKPYLVPKEQNWIIIYLSVWK
jgi:hypothetical protein